MSQPNITQERIQNLIKIESNLLSRPLTQSEIHSIEERVAFEEKHKGHESQHATMAIILLSSLILSQILITLWKQKYPRSYHTMTLLGLWIVPLCMAISAGNWRFVAVHALFSLINSLIVYRAMESPMKSNTPKIVYSWYSYVYAISYGIGVIGYIIVLIAFFHIPKVVNDTVLETEAKIFEAGILILFYGLYFGTLGRDFVDRLSDKMATTMGFYSKSGFPSRNLTSHTCAICGETTLDQNSKFTLDCKHIFHEVCIRGWTIIGKKDMCPCCKEKVDMNAFKKNPWDTAQILYLNLLDTLRYVLVWNPVVFLVVHVVFKLFGFQ